MDLTRRLNQVLQVRSGQEVPQAHKLAVTLVLHVNDPPTVLATADLTAIDDDAVFGSDDSERDEVFEMGVEMALFFVLLVVIVGVHAEVVEGEFFLDALFEGKALFESEGVGLGDHRDDIYNIREFLEDNDVDWFKTTRIISQVDCAIDVTVLRRTRDRRAG